MPGFCFCTVNILSCNTDNKTDFGNSMQTNCQCNVTFLATPKRYLFVLASQFFRRQVRKYMKIVTFNKMTMSEAVVL